MSASTDDRRAAIWLRWLINLPADQWRWGLEQIPLERLREVQRQLRDELQRRPPC